MPNFSLIGRCGLYCGACGIYRAYRDGGPYLEKIASSFGCSPNLVRCEGCQDLTEECWGNDCRIVRCLRKRKMNFCYECEVLETCEKFEKLRQEYLQVGINLIENLERIKSGDIESWLEEQDKKWRCTTCGKKIACHMEECHQCGAIVVGIND